MTEQQQYPTREQVAEAIRNSDWDSLGDWNAEPERIKDDYRKNADSVLALFPQPTPSAELTEQAPGSDLWAHRTGPSTIAVRRGYRVVLSLTGDDEAGAVARSILGLIPTPPIAEPPGIADMTPGTTFWANGKADRYTYIGHNKIREESGQGTWWASKVDPSTIRDVTPPKGDCRG